MDDYDDEYMDALIDDLDDEPDGFNYSEDEDDPDGYYCDYCDYFDESYEEVAEHEETCSSNPEIKVEKFREDENGNSTFPHHQFLAHLGNQEFKFFTAFKSWGHVQTSDGWRGFVITSNNLDDNSRLDAPVDFVDFVDFENAGNSLIIWLFNTIWNSGYTHGDLTSGNLLFSGNTQIQVIDWWDTLTEKRSQSIGEPIHLFRVLLDLYDVLDSINKYSNGSNNPQHIAGFGIKYDDKNIFNELYEVIKQHESEPGEYAFHNGIIEEPDRIKRILQWMQSNDLYSPQYFNNIYEDIENGVRSGGRRRKRRKRKKNKTKKRCKKKTKKRCKKKTKKRCKKKTKRRKSRN